MILFSKSAIQELSAQKPALSTPRGELFISPNFPVAGIKLKIPAEKYSDTLEDLGEKAFVVPQEEGPFDILISAPVSVSSGKIFLNGEEATLL